MSSFVGQKFYDKVYKDEHPELLFQHRGKGRWYVVSDEDATVPPPQQALRKFKAEKKSATSVKPEGSEPQEPRATRKRRAVVDLEDQPELKATRTRKGAAPDVAIDVDDTPPKGPEDPLSPAGEAEDSGDEIPVARLKSAAKPKSKAVAKAPVKKAAAAPRKRKPFPTESITRAESNGDMAAMGITMEDLAKRGPEPAVDAMAQITVWALKRQNATLAARFVAFEKKQAKRAAARESGIPKRTGAGGNNTQISIDEDGKSSNWVLFDPLLDFPPTHGPVPETYQRLARYMPGNPKILAYNTVSTSVSLYPIPKFFRGFTVEYHKTGPILVEQRGMGPDAPPFRPDSPDGSRSSDGIEGLDGSDSLDEIEARVDSPLAGPSTDE